MLAGFTVSRTVFGNIKLVTVDANRQNELPFEGVLPTADYYIVSMMALQALKDCKLEGIQCLAPGSAIHDKDFQEYKEH